MRLCDFFTEGSEYLRLDIDKYFHVWRVVEEIDNFKFLPNHSFYKTLAYFSMLESLLTIDPYKKKCNQKKNSIGQQLREKIPKLNKNIAYHIDFQSYFSTTQDDETIIRALYDYRSKIAHGEKIDFSSEDLSLLQDQSHVLALISTIVKKAVCYALVEPEFITLGVQVFLA
jgi:hypothetical protein